MARRSTTVIVLPLALMLAGLTAACGEQVPGGTNVGPPQPEAQHSSDQNASGQEQSSGDDDNPIVVKIGNDEYRTNMAIYRKYDESKAGPLALEAPVAEAEEIPGGKKQDFETGTVYWSPATGAHIVRGEILKTYLDSGGPEGTLGFPTGDETTEADVVFSEFERGRIQLKDQAIEVIEVG